MKTLYICIITAVLFALSGCGSLHIGVKEEQINAEQYPTIDKFLDLQRVAVEGTSEPVFLGLIKNGGNQNIAQLNKADEVQKILFGTISPLADKKDISDISSWILSHHIFSLPYKNLRTEFWFNALPIAYNIEQRGPNMSMIFITKNDENSLSSPYVLMKVFVTGTENDKVRTKEYIWNGLSEALIGAAKKMLSF